MKESTQNFLERAKKLSKKLAKKAGLDTSYNDGDLQLWARGIAPEGEEHLGGQECLLDYGPIIGLEHGVTREEIEEYLTLNGAENAVFRAIAVKAGVSVPCADWFWFK